MTIPFRLQVFERPISISTKDEERLKPLLSGFPTLVKVLYTTLNEPDLQQLVILELAGQQRPAILKRLVGRLHTLSRNRIEARIVRIIAKPTKL